ncbi:MAG: hypothetical protein JSS82_15630 [Bacteroidetes bacterium]|nr:hypothetical protein [Bacteroidota bacterium]
MSWYGHALAAGGVGSRAYWKHAAEVKERRLKESIRQMTEYVSQEKDEQLDVLFPTGHTLEAVTELHKSLCAEALSLVEKKGADYNRSEQQNGDTLANLKMSAKLGLVETPAHGVLVRLLDKLMRLKSLCKPGEKPANVDEKVRDTVVDVINYAVYVYALSEGVSA